MATPASELVLNGHGPNVDAENPSLHTASTITISVELFEKLSLASKAIQAPTNATKYANGAPLGILGFVMSAFTLSMILMGWGGASIPTAVAGIFFFTGPLLLILSTIFSWIQGAFYSYMLTGLFLVFWLSFGMLQLPTLGLAKAYSSAGDAAAGAASKEFNAAIALYSLMWGFALFTFWVFTLRIEMVTSGIIGFSAVSSWLQSGGYWALSAGHFSKALKLQKASGATLFVVAVLGWYLLVVIMAAELGWAVLPLGDLSHLGRGKDVEMAGRENDKTD